MKHFIKFLAILLLCHIHAGLRAEDGYRLWLRYDLIQEASLLKEYREQIQGWMIQGESETLRAAKDELLLGLNGLLGPVPSVSSMDMDGILVAGITVSYRRIIEKCFLSGLRFNMYIPLRKWDLYLIRPESCINLIPDFTFDKFYLKGIYGPEK